MKKNYYNPIINEENSNIIEVTLANATEEDLPIMFDCDDPETLSLEHVIPFSRRLREDTGWDCVFHYYVSEYDEKLHCTIEVDKLGA